MSTPTPTPPAPSDDGPATTSSGPSWLPYILAAGTFLGYQLLKGVFAPRAPLSQATLDKTQSLIVSDKVVVFSKTHCPYCRSTKQLLAELGVGADSGKNLTVLELDRLEDGPAMQDALQEITGQRTVPNIFIGGKHIGGNSDLQGLKRQGKLVELLKLADVL